MANGETLHLVCDIDTLWERCLLDRLQRHRQFNPQAIRPAVEMQGTAAALDDGLDNRQTEAATGALAIAPEALGQVLQVVFGNSRTVVAHQKVHAIAIGFQAQLHRPIARRVAQGVVCLLYTSDAADE